MAPGTGSKQNVSHAFGREAHPMDNRPGAALLFPSYTQRRISSLKRQVNSQFDDSRPCPGRLIKVLGTLPKQMSSKEVTPPRHESNAGEDSGIRQEANSQADA
jgi:hypothetical protein